MKRTPKAAFFIVALLIVALCFTSFLGVYERYGDRVDSPIIDKGEADFIVSFELLEAARWFEYLKPGRRGIPTPFRLYISASSLNISLLNILSVPVSQDGKTDEVHRPRVYLEELGI